MVSDDGKMCTFQLEKQSDESMTDAMSSNNPMKFNHIFRREEAEGGEKRIYH